MQHIKSCEVVLESLYESIHAIVGDLNVLVYGKGFLNLLLSFGQIGASWVPWGFVLDFDFLQMEFCIASILIKIEACGVFLTFASVSIDLGELGDAFKYNIHKLNF